MEKFRITVASLPDRKRLVAEIIYEGVQWAEISQEIDYNLGYLMALYEVIDTMKQQAAAFNIKQEDIGLADINVEKDLL